MYEVEEIVSSRIGKRGRKQYFVKWVGYDSSQNTWEPEKNLVNVKEALDQFLKKEEKKSFNFGSNNRRQSSRASKDYFREVYNENESLGEQQIDMSNQLDGQFQNSEDKSSMFRKGKKQRIKKGRPPGFLKIKKGERIDIKILGMNELENQNLIYKIEINGKTQWVKKGFFIPDYMFELIQFYESKILFKDDEENETK